MRINTFSGSWYPSYSQECREGEIRRGSFPHYIGSSITKPEVLLNAIELAAKVCFSLLMLTWLRGISATVRLTSCVMVNYATYGASELVACLAYKKKLSLRLLALVAVHYGSYLRTDWYLYKVVDRPSDFSSNPFIEFLCLFVYPPFLGLFSNLHTLINSCS